MTQLLASILTADAASITRYADVLRVVRLTIPNVRRDELLIALANAGYSLNMISDVAVVSGVKLA